MHHGWLPASGMPPPGRRDRRDLTQYRTTLGQARHRAGQRGQGGLVWAQQRRVLAWQRAHRDCLDEQIESLRGFLTLSDQKAWQEETAYIRGRVRIQRTLGAQHHWTREELYDDRLQRFSH